MKEAEAIQEPETPGEWQDAVDGAEFWLMVDSAIQYGLMEMIGDDGKPMKGSRVNVDRCLKLLELGKERGIVPDPHLLEKLKTSILAKNSPPGRRCKLPRDYFIKLMPGRK